MGNGKPEIPDLYEEVKNMKGDKLWAGYLRISQASETTGKERSKLIILASEIRLRLEKT